jgi:hypothetical protein
MRARYVGRLFVGKKGTQTRPVNGGQKMLSECGQYAKYSMRLPRSFGRYFLFL